MKSTAPAIGIILFIGVIGKRLTTHGQVTNGVPSTTTLFVYWHRDGDRANQFICDSTYPIGSDKAAARANELIGYGVKAFYTNVDYTDPHVRCPIDKRKAILIGDRY